MSASERQWAGVEARASKKARDASEEPEEPRPPRRYSAGEINGLESAPPPTPKPTATQAQASTIERNRSL